MIKLTSNSYNIKLKLRKFGFTKNRIYKAKVLSTKFQEEYTLHSQKNSETEE